ncbi:MAG: hypothetical protein J6U54_01945 [Clostridiales bacterium]|nr:hypothetical protein [Clostridiales bacterium]
MIIIVGNKHFTHHRGRTADEITCPSCGLTFHFVLNTVSSWFTMVFIPVFPYRFKRRCECPYCRTGLRVDKAQYDAFLKTRIKDRIRHI